MLKQVLIVLGSATLILAIYVLGCLSYVGHGMYRVEDSVEVTSPDNKYIATGFHVVGSAVVHNSTIVQIRSNKFSDEKHPVFVVDNLAPFNIAWTQNNELEVTYTEGPIHMQQFNWKDVAIKYNQK